MSLLGLFDLLFPAKKECQQPKTGLTLPDKYLPYFPVNSFLASTTSPICSATVVQQPPTADAPAFI